MDDELRLAMGRKGLSPASPLTTLFGPGPPLGALLSSGGGARGEGGASLSPWEFSGHTAPEELVPWLRSRLKGSRWF